MVIGKILLCLISVFCAVFGIMNTPDVAKAETSAISNSIKEPQYINSVYDNINVAYYLLPTKDYEVITQIGGTYKNSMLTMYNGVYYDPSLRASNMSSRNVQFPSRNGTSIFSNSTANLVCSFILTFNVPVPVNTPIFLGVNSLLNAYSESDYIYISDGTNSITTEFYELEDSFLTLSNSYNYNTSTLYTGEYNVKSPSVPLTSNLSAIKEIHFYFTIDRYTAYSYPVNQITIGTYGDYAAYDQGYQNGFTAGETQGYQSGVNYANSIVNENSASYLQGYQNGVNSSNGLIDMLNGVVSAPVQVVLQTLDFQIFGVSVVNFVLSIICIGVIVVIIKMIL